MARIPVVFGWGKKGKEIGYVGIDKCPNCRHYVHFYIYEYANRVNVYFVPIAKFNKKHYLVCPVCDAAYELSDDLKNEYFSKMYSAMDSQSSQDIFSTSIEIISENIEEEFSKDNIEIDEKISNLINLCIKKLDKKYHNKEYIDKVARVAFQYLLDEDKPE